MEKVGTSKILIIGATGFVGKFMVEASAKAGHPTFALVRESTLSDPSKSSIIQTFNTLGVNLLLVRNNFLHAQSLSIFFFCFCSGILLHQVFSPVFLCKVLCLIVGLMYTQGDVRDHQSLVEAIKKVDVVISIVSHTQLDVQYKIISAIKEAGNVKVPPNLLFLFFNMFACTFMQTMMMLIT